MNKIIKKIIEIRNYLIYKRFDFLSKIDKSKLRVNEQADFVVSIASYPKRIHLLPSVFQALNNQTAVPKKWILVLSEEEWPELQLPKPLNELIRRGLEIVWVRNNSFAVKKLVPVMKKYPKLGVITLDDDKIYHKSLIEGLINFTIENPNTIVGYMGRSMVRKNNQLKMLYREKGAANISTPSAQVYLIGWGGIYYPAGSLHENVFSEEGIHRIVPGRGSDIWFWAAALAHNTHQKCLGLPEKYHLGIPIPQNKKTEPKDTPGLEVMEQRFQDTIDFFNIREKLNSTLPNTNIE